MSNAETSAGPILPAHIEETVKAIARLHAQHRKGATGLQRGVETLTRLFSRPLAAALLAAAAVGWILVNATFIQLGRPALDPPPYAFLGLATALAALLMTVFILITQRREDELSELREQLTLELAILSEQKAAKLIELLEELRHDLPTVKDRLDLEARSLAKPADPETVLEALKESQGAEVQDMPAELGQSRL
ncbi:MAG: DUF1003 domain-containing protein [Caulobacteraceae bacterium]|nr:DUF1003 domain-containing protein [Caulobacteraceae bacterium]